MSIVIIRQDDKIEQWKSALQTADPKLEVFGFDEKHNKNEVSMALVWKHPRGTLSKYPNLRCIASSGAGVDFIFEDKEAPLYLPITRIVDPMLANDMTEHVVALIFARLKNLNTYKLDQTNKIWQPKPYQRVADMTVSVLGLGALGLHLTKELTRLGFKAQGWSRSSKEITGVTTFNGDGQLPDFLKKTTILVCLLPLTKETEGILNKSLFEKLPQGAYIINVARGGHLVDEDLILSLNNNHLSGAALDVFHNEPLPLDHPFWEHPKVHISPHCASVSDTDSVVPQILENYQRLQKGKPLLNLVSKEKGY